MTSKEILLDLVKSMRAHLSLVEIELQRDNADAALIQIDRVQERVSDAIEELRAIA